MPSFNAYPASQVRAPDVWGAMQRGAEGAQMNQLRQMKINQAGQPDPGQALAREKFEYTKGQDERTAQAQQIKQAVGMLSMFADPNVPELQKAQAWPGMIAKARELWPNIKAPDQYDSNFVAQVMGQFGQYATQESDTVSPEREAQLGRIKAAPGPKEGADGKTPKGLSVPEAYNALLEEKTYTDAGGKAPQGVSRRAAVARHILTQKRYTRDAEGNIMSYTPGIPQGYGDGTPASAAPALGTTDGGQPASAAPSGRGLNLEKEAAPKIDIGPATSSIMAINELLKEAAQAGESITGAWGAAKSWGGGLARQGGLDISPRAANLQRRLLALQGQVGPMIMNEKRLSETERERLKKIVGEVSAMTDEIDLRESLKTLVEFLISVEEK